MLSLLLAGLADHTLTAVHYHDKVNTANKDAIAQVPMFCLKREHKDEAQRVAEEAFQNNLAKPFLEAEIRQRHKRRKI